MSVIPGQLAVGENIMWRSHREEHCGAEKPHQLHGQLTNEVQNGVAIARTYDSLNRPTGYTIMQNAECRMQNAEWWGWKSCQSC